ncbi:MAG: aminotransferase class I/II-fold pyridoxal phosphate-dependent enzyme [Planctomycetes bacterium]|nr:aminotransferase class I/II-fold pyridoxal phosphate-dependent enzyme [Planctomycetota bacterium]
MAPERRTSASRTARRLATFGTSIFGEVTRLAQSHGAINLGQGFPDFEGPPELAEAAFRAMRDGHNQYARPMGALPLVEAIAKQVERDHGLHRDPLKGVCVTSGATEAIAAALLGMLDPGDAVLTFEPFYDSYPAITAIAGARFDTVPLHFPDFRIDFDRLRSSVTRETKILLLNAPHNPTGRVFDEEELESLAALCIEHDLIAVCDDVYEHLWFDGAKHRPLASLPGMDERAITISSTGKTFSMTGWKIGWAHGPARLVASVFAAHQFLTFATANPLQHAMAFALETFDGPWLQRLRDEYAQRRQCLLDGLARSGFTAARPSGSYFVLARHDAFFDAAGQSDEPDVAIARRLIERSGVAAIPPSSFYREAVSEGRRLLRFAFCKRIETLRAAMDRLAKGL